MQRAAGRCEADSGTFRTRLGVALLKGLPETKTAAERILGRQGRSDRYQEMSAYRFLYEIEWYRVSRKPPRLYMKVIEMRGLFNAVQRDSARVRREWRKKRHGTV